MGTERILVTLVTIPDCEPCERARDLVDSFAAANRSLDIEVRLIDGIIDAAEVVRMGANEHPTLILEVDGQERARLSGSLSSRKVLRRLLPLLYRDDEVALEQLREQLGSPTEEFPSGPLRGRVRVAEKLELMGGVPLFQGLSKRHLTQLVRLADEIHRDDGEILIEEGQPGDEFFVVAEGAAKVVKRGRTVAVLAAGDHFGEMSLFDSRPRSATVVATAPSTLIVVHRADFDRYLMRSPTMMRTLLTTLAERLR